MEIMIIIIKISAFPSPLAIYPFLAQRDIACSYCSTYFIGNYTAALVGCS